MNTSNPIIVNFTSQRELENQAYQIILKTVNDAFAVAKGNLELMQNLNQLSKELKHATESEIDSLLRGPVPEKVQFEVA